MAPAQVGADTCNICNMETDMTPQQFIDTAKGLTDEARAAFKRCIKPDGRLRRTAPDWRKDPHGWAAWQGFQTAMGYHGEGATFKLLMLDEAARKTWDQISDLAFAARRVATLRRPAATAYPNQGA